MSIAITSDHQALAEVAQSFLRAAKPRDAARALLDAPDETLPAFWSDLTALGWLGLHLPEEYGGSGAGLPELAVVLEELGRGVTPGPFLPTVIASAVLAEAGDDVLRKRLLPGLADGTTLGAVGFGGSLTRSGDTVSGDAGDVLGGTFADVFLLTVGDDLVVAERSALTVAAGAGLDQTRRLTRVHADKSATLAVIDNGAVVARRLGRALAAAEAAGGASACVEAAVSYAKVRVQFGRTIGSFQAVKHHCANMFAEAELATAVAWDAVRPAASVAEAELAAAYAAAKAFPAFSRTAEMNIQVQGGIAFTWEHDAHLYLRRAASLAQVFGPRSAALDDVVRLVETGARRAPTLDLPPEAAAIRDEARAWVAEHRNASAAELRSALVGAGYITPHWPKPYGRAAGAVEQLVIDEEFSELEVPNLGIGGWVTLTLLQHSTPEQIERWIAPSLAGDLVFCQLFSEPNAGSDAAAVQTKAEKVEGGWKINGQKVWTSGAQYCNRGLATVRTDTTVKKHAGITAMVIDMHAPGVEVRPLREITGEALFNEVFFDDVFVPDADVVGEVNGGWAVARATLGNERVSIGGGKSSMGISAYELLALATQHAPGDTGTARDVGSLIADDQALRILNVRQAARAVAGGPPGPEGNVSKMLGAEHQQHVSELGIALTGTSGVDGSEPEVAHSYLMSRCLTIAGGTSEVVRNVIAERILGLPRDPLLN